MGPRAVALQTRLNADTSIPAWDANSKRDFALSALLPTLMIGVHVDNVVNMIRDPSIVWWAAPAGLVSAGLTYLAFKDRFIKTGHYLRAFFSKDPRAILRPGHPHFDNELGHFFRLAEILSNEGASNLVGPRVVWALTTDLTELLIEPPMIEDPDVVRENYDTLLIQALADTLSDARTPLFSIRLLDMNFRYFHHPETGVPHLRVHVEIVNPTSSWRGRKPDELRRALAERPDPAVTPEPAVGGAIPQGI